MRIATKIAIGTVACIVLAKYLRKRREDAAEARDNADTGFSASLPRRNALLPGYAGVGQPLVSCLDDTNSGINTVRPVTYRQRMESALHSKISEAVNLNLGFKSTDRMACDTFVTKVLSDAGIKPDDWPDPDWASVKDYRAYMKSELRPLKSLFGYLTLVHYTHGKVAVQNFMDESDFLARMPYEVYVYDTAEYKGLE